MVVVQGPDLSLCFLWGLYKGMSLYMNSIILTKLQRNIRQLSITMLVCLILLGRLISVGYHNIRSKINS